MNDAEAIIVCSVPYHKFNSMLNGLPYSLFKVFDLLLNVLVGSI